MAQRDDAWADHVRRPHHPSLRLGKRSLVEHRRNAEGSLVKVMREKSMDEEQAREREVAREPAYLYEFRASLKRIGVAEENLHQVVQGQAAWNEEIEALLTHSKTLAKYLHRLPSISLEENEEAQRLIGIADRARSVVVPQRRRIRQEKAEQGKKTKSVPFSYQQLAYRYETLRTQLSVLRRSYRGARPERLASLDSGRRRIAREGITLLEELRNRPYPKLAENINHLIERAERDPRTAGTGSIRLVSGGMPTLGRRRR